MSLNVQFLSDLSEVAEVAMCVYVCVYVCVCVWACLSHLLTLSLLMTAFCVVFLPHDLGFFFLGKYFFDTIGFKPVANLRTELRVWKTSWKTRCGSTLQRLAGEPLGSRVSNFSAASGNATSAA